MERPWLAFSQTFLTLNCPKSFRKSLFQVRPRTSVKSGTVTKECPTAFSQREFTLCRIIVFALHLKTLLSRERPQGASPIERSSWTSLQIRSLPSIWMVESLTGTRARNECLGGRNRSCSDSPHLKP